MCLLQLRALGANFTLIQPLAAPKVGEVSRVEQEVTLAGQRAADLESNGELGGFRHISLKGHVL